MKKILPQLLKCRLVQAGGLLAIIAAAAATVAWSGGSQALAKFEGAWMAQSDNGIRSLVTFAPSDPASRRGAFRNQMVWPPEALALLGVEAVTEEIGDTVATGPASGEYTGVWYGLVSGRTVSICVDNASLTLVSPTQITIEHTVLAYLATADADNDGYPDPGTTPVAAFTTSSVSKRLVHERSVGGDGQSR